MSCSFVSPATSANYQRVWFTGPGRTRQPPGYAGGDPAPSGPVSAEAGAGQPPFCPPARCRSTPAAALHRPPRALRDAAAEPAPGRRASQPGPAGARVIPPCPAYRRPRSDLPPRGGARRHRAGAASPGHARACPSPAASGAPPADERPASPGPARRSPNPPPVGPEPGPAPLPCRCHRAPFSREDSPQPV